MKHETKITMNKLIKILQTQTESIELIYQSLSLIENALDILQNDVSNLYDATYTPTPLERAEHEDEAQINQELGK